MTHTGEEARRSLLLRARERLRFGLATQETIDGLARLGLLFYPYSVVEEPFRPNPGLAARLQRYALRRLVADDAPLVAGLPCRILDVETTRRRLDDGICFGLFDGPRLLGYTWARFDRIGAAGHACDAIGALPPDSAYLHDAYVARAARGLQLAPALRHGVHAALAAHGCRRFFSITAQFNASSRRFKRKLGAEEFELRLVVGRPKGLAADLLLWRRERRAPLPRFQWLRLP